MNLRGAMGEDHSGLRTLAQVGNSGPPQQRDRGTRTRIGRNDPCPCGSGRKYKLCCGRREDAAQADVLYIHPSKQGLTLRNDHQTMGRPYGLMPIGVVGLVNLLRQNGITVRGINLPLEQALNHAFDLRQWLADQRRARIVLLDLHWYEHSFGAIDLARVCREVLPEVWTVLGGLTASAFAREILEKHPAVDIIVRGDAEQPLLQLVKRLLEHTRSEAGAADLYGIGNLSYRDGEKLVETPLTYCAAREDLDRLDFTDLSFLEHERQYCVTQYVLTGLIEKGDPLSISGHWLCIARGCHYECSFCGGCRTAHRALAGRDMPVTRSPARVADDLQRLETKGVLQAGLSFDLSELGEDYWRALFAEMDRLGVKIGLYNEFFQLPTDAFLGEFVRRVEMPHTCLAFSPLSGSELVRRVNGKRYSNEQLFHTLELCKKHGLPILVYFSLNLPGENEQTLEETLALAQRVCAYYPPHLIRMLNTLHTLDPSSPMSRRPGSFGIEASMSTFADYYHYCALTSVANPEARLGAHRGFGTEERRSLIEMAKRWDDFARGREPSVLPLPTSW